MTTFPINGFKSAYYLLYIPRAETYIYKTERFLAAFNKFALKGTVGRQESHTTNHLWHHAKFLEPKEIILYQLLPQMVLIF